MVQFLSDQFHKTDPKPGTIREDKAFDDRHSYYHPGFFGKPNMSGVYGVVYRRKPPELPRWAVTMADGMCHQPWYVAEQLADDDQGVLLGRIGIGIFNPQPQPLWNADHTIALVMAGEFYNALSLGCPPGLSAEAFALHLYQSAGDSFAQQLHGAFVIAIWDVPAHKLLITNDRFGLYNLFYAHLPDRLVFAPEMKGILHDPAFRKQLDLTALAQYMRFQQLLGNRTFFENLLLLPPASVLTYLPISGQFHIQPYWSYAQVPHHPHISLPEAIEEAGRLLRQTVRRLSEDAFRPGVFLSGGLDGRTILGLTQRRPIHSINFGVKNAADVVYAERIARAAGADHHWVEFTDGKWVLEHMDQHLALTEGFHSFIHMHGISALPLARSLFDVNLSGWDGGTVMGYPDANDILQYDPVSEEAFICQQFYLCYEAFTWPGMIEGEERMLYSDEVAQQLHGAAFDSFCSELNAYMDYRRDVRHEFFFIDTQCRRMTHNMIVIGRSHIEQRYPFFDYDLFDFLLSLPTQLRLDQTLYRGVIQKELPHLARIPYNLDHLPPTPNKWWRGLARWKHRIQSAINRYALPIFPEYSSLYADYEKYLRTDLAQWAREIVLDPRTAERGLFRPSFLETLLNRHLSGRELHTIGKIAPLLTYELMLRKYYD